MLFLKMMKKIVKKVKSNITFFISLCKAKIKYCSIAIFYKKKIIQKKCKQRILTPNFSYKKNGTNWQNIKIVYNENKRWFIMME